MNTLRHPSASSAPDSTPNIKPWITQSPMGYRCLSLARQAATTPLSVYLSGETGTGKEVLARWIHAWSERAHQPFVALHCGALTPNLAESELFGHTRGAFTGAQGSRPGALMQADGGTLFLDEVGDLSPEVQVKLLRFLENGELRPLGSDQVRFADTRIVCATHLNLEQLVVLGKFRKDLYYRIAAIKIELPALRFRLEDVEPIAAITLRHYDKRLDHEALVILQNLPWEGNVRELIHALQRACAFCERERRVLGAKDFEFLLEPRFPAEKQPEEAEAATSWGTIEQMEKQMLLRALQTTHGRRDQAAKLLGIARSTLFAKIRQYELR